MIYLVLNIILSSCFILIMRWIQGREEDIITVGAINYVAAGIAAALLFTAGDTPGFGRAAFFTGAINGIGYFAAFFFLVGVLDWKGAAISAVVARLSILVPVVVGVAWWGERPSSMQSLGVVLACISLVLVGYRGNLLGKSVPAYVHLLLAGLFLLAGSSRLAQEAFKYVCQPHEMNTYLATVFWLSGCASLVLLAIRRRPITGMELGLGVIVGLCNFLQTMYLLMALDSLPGYIVFPVTSAGGLLFTSVVAVWALGERLNRPSYAGIGLAITSLALLNTGA